MHEKYSKNVVRKLMSILFLRQRIIGVKRLDLTPCFRNLIEELIDSIGLQAIT